MPFKEFLTTGEAARLLNISRSTVSRDFDRGLLQGRKNPITGERLISRDSLISFMKKYKLSPDPSAIGRKKILLGTSDEQILAAFHKVISGDDRIQVDRAAFGCDVLVGSSRSRVDLLLIDEHLPDISTAEVIKSLRRMEEQKDLKILCTARLENAEQCSSWGADEVLVKDALDERTLAEKVYGLLDLPEAAPALMQKFQHRRRWPRTSINVPAKIEVYTLQTPQFSDSGKAVVDNISRGGAQLVQIQTEKKVLPCEPFRILLEIDHAPLKNLRVHSRVVRLQSNGDLNAGIQFTRLSRINQKKIEAIAPK